MSCEKNHYPNSLYSQGSFANPFVLLFAATTVAFAQSMLQQPLSQTVRGEMGKPVVT